MTAPEDAILKMKQKQKRLFKEVRAVFRQHSIEIESFLYINRELIKFYDTDYLFIYLYI
jgi:hypothetical protein